MSTNINTIDTNAITPPSNGVATSNMASNIVQTITGRQRRRIYEYLRSLGRYGGTADEIEIALGLSGNAIRPRIGELEHMGFIVRTDEKRLTRQGCPAFVYVLVEVALGDLANDAEEVRP